MNVTGIGKDIIKFLQQTSFWVKNVLFIRDFLRPLCPKYTYKFLNEDK